MHKKPSYLLYYNIRSFLIISKSLLFKEVFKNSSSWQLQDIFLYKLRCYRYDIFLVGFDALSVDTFCTQKQ